MDSQAAIADIDYIRGVVRRTHARIDTHAFHSVSWGTIVLIWYPLANWFQNRGMLGWMAGVGIGAVVLGSALSALLEIRLSKKPGLTGEDTFILRQVVRIVACNIAVGMTLSALGPITGFIAGPHVPILWGLLYANMAFMIGVVYTREYMVAGMLIFVGAVIAILFADYAGYILGPFMGFGMIVPGLLGERRVARLREEADGDE
ncbi:MAG: hypothetical protein ACYSX0_01275 [Planctomycetota bacterium]|jgi:hypothetical protein